MRGEVTVSAQWTDKPLQLTVYQGEAGFQALRAEWNPLLSRSSSDTLFLTWEFQYTWWRCLGEGSAFLLACRDGEELVGLAPLYIVEAEGMQRVRLVGGIEVADYLDLIAAPGYERALVRAMLGWLAGPEAPSWDLLEMVNVPEEGILCAHLAAVAAELGWHARSVFEDVCPVIPLPDTWDAYLAMLGKHQRHEIRRKIRRIEREARVRWYIVDTSHDLELEVSRFITLHELSRPDKEAFMTPAMKRFFQALARVMLEAGWLQLSFIEVNGEPAASMLCFDYRDGILVYNSGYDPAKYARLSPGIVLLSYCIQRAIHLGKRRFDFLQGGEEYKYRFGGRDTRVYRIIVQRPAVCA